MGLVRALALKIQVRARRLVSCPGSPGMGWWRQGSHAALPIIWPCSTLYLGTQDLTAGLPFPTPRDLVLTEVEVTQATMG